MGLDKTRKYQKITTLSSGSFLVQDGVEYRMNGEPIVKEPPSFESMHHTQLKKRIKAAGVEWTTREAAIEFLKSQ